MIVIVATVTAAYVRTLRRRATALDNRALRPTGAKVFATLSTLMWLFPIVESLHVLTITIVVGSIAMVDLRLLGWASRECAVSPLSAEVLPWTWLSYNLTTLRQPVQKMARAAAELLTSLIGNPGGAMEKMMHTAQFIEGGTARIGVAW